MSSRFLTFFWAISTCRMLFFSRMEIGCRLRSKRRLRRSPIAVDDSTPVITVPSAVAHGSGTSSQRTPTSGSQCVDASDDFRDGRDVLVHQGQPLGPQG